MGMQVLMALYGCMARWNGPYTRTGTSISPPDEGDEVISLSHSLSLSLSQLLSLSRSLSLSLSLSLALSLPLSLSLSLFLSLFLSTNFNHLRLKHWDRVSPTAKGDRSRFGAW